MPVTLIDNYQNFRPDQLSRIKSGARYLLHQNNLNEQNFNIVLTDDREIAHYNKKYRNLNGPTNVLSFPFQADFNQPDSVRLINELGDIIISVETAEREAKQYDQSLYHRLSWLIAHGLLHLLGYDHERSEADAIEMYDLEEQLIHDLFNRRRTGMTNLSVNIGSVAAIRQAGGTAEPDPVTAAAICELAGARGIVVHIPEDRLHIQERDVKVLRETVQTKLNLEMGITKDLIKLALDIRPDIVTIIQEKRQAAITKDALDVVSQKKKIARTIEKMTRAGIPVSLFIDADLDQVKTSYDIGATYVELNTKLYAESPDPVAQLAAFSLIEAAAEEAWQRGLHVHAGHGLNYVNSAPIAALETVEELSIGHAIISRALFSGLDCAVRDMDTIIQNASKIL